MSKIPFTPLFARVLLRREKKEKIGSIILPATSIGKYTKEEGILIALGHTADEALKTLLNQKVMFAKHSGAWVKIGEDEYFMCQDEDLLGVIYE